MFSRLCVVIMLAIAPFVAFAEPPPEKKPSLLFDLEIGYRSTDVDFDSETQGGTAAIANVSFFEVDSEHALQANGVAARGRVHLPIEAIRGTAFLEIGGAWIPDADAWADRVTVRFSQTLFQGTRLDANGSAFVAAGFRWGIPIGPVELGLRPYGGVSWSFYEVGVRRQTLSVVFDRGTLSFERSWFEKDNRFVVSSGVVGGAIELLPCPKRLGLYLYAGGGYEIPFADARETARARGPTYFDPFIGSYRIDAFGEVEIQHSWYLEAGIGWRFRAPF